MESRQTGNKANQITSGSAKVSSPYHVRPPFIIFPAIFLLVFTFFAWQHFRTVTRSREEAALKLDLYVMREAIRRYATDKQRAPSSLQDLVDTNYLREIPIDPLTRRSDWVPQRRTVFVPPDQSILGIVDIHSNSQNSSLDGSHYNVW